jgi:hypothetical protein
MTFKVFQFWNGQPATIREVELPPSVVDDNKAKHITHGNEGVRIGFLNAIYHYGQNEVQNRMSPSVSVGDIIELALDGEYEFWIVANAGFENFGREKHFLFQPRFQSNAGVVAG